MITFNGWEIKGGSFSKTTGNSDVSDSIISDTQQTAKSEIYIKSDAVNTSEQSNSLIHISSAKKFSAKNSFSIVFRLGENMFFQNGEGMVSFAFFDSVYAQNQTVTIPMNIKYCKNDSSWITDSTVESEKCGGLGTELCNYNNNSRGFALTLLADKNANGGKLVTDYKFTVKNMSLPQQTINGIHSTLYDIFVYEDSLPHPIDLSRSATLTFRSINGYLKLYLNGMCIAEFADDALNDITMDECYFAMCVMGGAASPSEIYISSVDEVAASQWCQPYGDMLRDINKYKNIAQLTPDDKDEVGNIISVYRQYENSLGEKNAEIIANLENWYDAQS